MWSTCFSLAVLCVADPCANEETFTAPSQQQRGDDEVTPTTGSLQQFIFSLLKVIDESCVPVFMVSSRLVISEPSIDINFILIVGRLVTLILF